MLLVKRQAQNIEALNSECSLHSFFSYGREGCLFFSSVVSSARQEPALNAVAASEVGPC